MEAYSGHVLQCKKHNTSPYCLCDVTEVSERCGSPVLVLGQNINLVLQAIMSCIHVSHEISKCATQQTVLLYVENL